MRRGGHTIILLGAAAMSGCTGEDGKLEMRAIPSPISAKAPATGRIAEAQAFLAMGNVGLALESFRLAAREDPNNPDAYLGIAAAYDRMGRFDLSRRAYETALALAPTDRDALGALARSLDTQGLTEEAFAVREEIRTRLAAAQPAPAIDQTAIASRQVVTATGASVTIALPPAREPITVARQPEQVSLAMAEAARLARPAAGAVAPELSTTPIAASHASPGVRWVPLAPVAEQFADADEAPLKLSRPSSRAPQPARFAEALRVGGSLNPQLQSVSLAQPVEDEPIRMSRPRTEAARLALAEPLAAKRGLDLKLQQVALANPAPVDDEPVKIARPMAPDAKPAAFAERLAPARSGPHLERMSLGEVALITTAVEAVAWTPQVVARTAQSTTVRFVPLREANARNRLPNFRVLNAARLAGLAARTRGYLFNRGWREMAIGDAPKQRATSLILYPESRRRTAERLSVQFGFPIQRQARGDELVLLLGRDAARHFGKQS